MIIKLSECPFCGNDDIDTQHITHKFFPDEFEITCHSEDCFATVSAASLEDVIKRWNRRTVNA